MSNNNFTIKLKLNTEEATKQLNNFKKSLKGSFTIKTEVSTPKNRISTPEGSPVKMLASGIKDMKGAFISLLTVLGSLTLAINRSNEINQSGIKAAANFMTTGQRYGTVQAFKSSGGTEAQADIALNAMGNIASKMASGNIGDLNPRLQAILDKTSKNWVTQEGNAIPANILLQDFIKALKSPALTDAQRREIAAMAGIDPETWVVAARMGEKNKEFEQNAPSEELQKLTLEEIQARTVLISQLYKLSNILLEFVIPSLIMVEKILIPIINFLNNTFGTLFNDMKKLDNIFDGMINFAKEGIEGYIKPFKDLYSMTTSSMLPNLSSAAQNNQNTSNTLNVQNLNISNAKDPDEFMQWFNSQAYLNNFANINAGLT